MDFNKIKSVKDVSVKNKTAIIRTDFNVPLDKKGNIKDDRRIKNALPTINYLLKNKVKKIIIITHLGRPKNKNSLLRTNKIAKKLSSLLKRRVIKLDDWGESQTSKKILEEKKNKIIVLENLRFHKAEKTKDKKQKQSFAKQLASLADVYINEAFSNSHRDHASMTGVPKYIPGVAGINLKKELTTLQTTIKNPKRPFIAIIGGLKADKLNAASHLLKKADKILLAGALPLLLLKLIGKEVGKSKTDIEGFKQSKHNAQKLIKNKKLLLPTDVIITKKIEKNPKIKTTNIESIPKSALAVDIGKETIQNYIKIIKSAKTILWNGPIGVFEIPKLRKGTKAIANALAKSKAKTIIGGGDSDLAVKTLKLENKMSFISTGGGASLKIFEGKTLVALKPLKKKKFFKQ